MKGFYFDFKLGNYQSLSKIQQQLRNQNNSLQCNMNEQQLSFQILFFKVYILSSQVYMYRLSWRVEKIQAVAPKRISLSIFSKIYLVFFQFAKITYLSIYPIVSSSGTFLTLHNKVLNVWKYTISEFLELKIQISNRLFVIIVFHNEKDICMKCHRSVF